MKKHDVIVIGSGLGGLTAAAYLAAMDKKVLVLEQHDVAGGNCTVFRRKDYEFDVGLHYIGDCGIGGVFPALFRAIGLEGRLTFTELDPDGFDTLVFDRAASHIGEPFLVPKGWANYEQRLSERFPDQADAIADYMQVLQEVGNETRLLSIPGAQTPTLDKWSTQTLADLFSHCEFTPELQLVANHWSGLYGSGPADSAITMHALIVNHYMSGAFYVEGGGQELAARLVQIIEALGGEVRTLARVDQIQVAQGKVSGVRLTSGELLKSDIVVSNADYKRTVLELVESEHWTTETRQQAADTEMTLGLVVLYLGVDIDLTQDHRNCNYHLFFDPDMPGSFATLEAGQMTEDLAWIYLAMASKKDPHNPNLAPPGHTNFQIMTLAPRGYQFWGLDDDGPDCPSIAAGSKYRREDGYRRAKEKLTEQMLAGAETILGPFRDHIVHQEMATPLTHERYTLSSAGTSYGLQHSPEQSGRRRPGYQTEIEGLFLAGANTVAGHGIGGAIAGGVSCAGKIVDQPLLIEAVMGKVFVDPDRIPADDNDWDPVVVSRGAALRTKRAAGRAKRAQS